MTALQIALIVWRVVTKIEVYQQLGVLNDYGSVESENECDCSKCCKQNNNKRPMMKYIRA